MSLEKLKLNALDKSVKCDMLARLRMFQKTCTGLNSWSSVGRTDWEGLGGMAMLEEVCHQGQALRFYVILNSLSLFHDFVSR